MCKIVRSRRCRGVQARTGHFLLLGRLDRTKFGGKRETDQKQA
jgi:hypothetical protein